jgi:hypothetical protein
VRRSRFVRGRDAYTSICAPMMTVRSRGRANCSAPSAAMEEVAVKRRLGQGTIVGAFPRESSIFDKKSGRLVEVMPSSVSAGSSIVSAPGTSGVSIFPKRGVDLGDPVVGVAEVVDAQGIKTSFPRAWPL